MVLRFRRVIKEARVQSNRISIGTMCSLVRDGSARAAAVSVFAEDLNISS